VAFIASALTQIRLDLLLHTGIGFLNGAICAIVAMGALPFLETTFRVTTNTWLLELASPEQELLKELSMKAPGTYSHSVMVANLAEAGAREVDSDPMLARVASYYHDVGKMKRAQFFVENQPTGSNPHNSISPNLSSLVITSHVKDGVEMLEKNNFPPELVNIVRQHHGTGIIRYFYEQALEGQGQSAVDESRFRYHFEKPRGKTAGILLLADAVEATARTLNQPSVSTIEQLVDRIVEDKLEDGQLDECSLTFSDVTKTKKVFKKILINAYHIRVEYPIAKGMGAKGKGAGKG
jgi:putative nucleotidyltransferase with HDIG domain